MTDPPLPPPSPGVCPSIPARAEPDPQRRPVHEVVASVDVPGGVVDGTLTTRFTPDLPTDVVVFRLWPNGPRPAGHVTVGAVVDASTGAARAAQQPDPTTLEIAVPPLAAGDTATLRIPFRLELTGSASDRISHSGDTLRLGSFVPMLAWEPGVGWAREPATAAFAEAASHRRRRTGPSASTSRPATTSSRRAGANPTARGGRPRNVTSPCPIGHFALAQAAEVLPGGSGPVDVTVGVDAGVGEDPRAYLGRVLAALRDFSTRFGPYPWDTFTLAVTPGLDGGIEFPGHVMQGPDTLGRTTPHEVAHQWFYGLVGDDQGRDPWLDEGLASYAEFRHEGAVDSARRRDIPADAEGRAAAPMTYWEAPPVELLPRRLRPRRQRRCVARRRRGRRPRPRRLRAAALRRRPGPRHRHARRARGRPRRRVPRRRARMAPYTGR